MNSDTITLTKDEMFEVVRASKILTDFIEKHYKAADIYTDDFLESMDINSENNSERIRINTFEDFIN